MQAECGNLNYKTAPLISLKPHKAPQKRLSPESLILMVGDSCQLPGMTDGDVQYTVARNLVNRYLTHLPK